MDIKSLWSKYRLYFWIAIIAVFAGLIVVDHFYISGKIDTTIQAVKDKWNTDNREILDNIVILKGKQDSLDSQFKQNKADIIKLKNTKQQETNNVFSSNDPKQIAAYFDNVIDGFTPSK